MKPSPALATPLHRRATPMRVALAWLLMLAVLFGQGLGAVHTISHGAPGAGDHAHAPSAAPRWHGAACEHGPEHVHDGRRHVLSPAQAPDDLQAWFGHAPDEPGCRLYDQLLQAGPLMPVSTVLAVPVSTRTIPPPDIGVRLAARAAVYLARGPPRA
jgi:hypothetical protein